MWTYAEQSDLFHTNGSIKAQYQLKPVDVACCYNIRPDLTTSGGFFKINFFFLLLLVVYKYVATYITDPDTHLNNVINRSLSRCAVNVAIKLLLKST